MTNAKQRRGNKLSRAQNLHTDKVDTIDVGNFVVGKIMRELTHDVDGGRIRINWDNSAN